MVEGSWRSHIATKKKNKKQTCDLLHLEIGNTHIFFCHQWAFQGFFSYITMPVVKM